MARLGEDLPGEEDSHPSEAAGDQVSAVILEFVEQRLLVGCDVLPARHETRLPLESHERFQAESRLPAEPRRERLSRDGFTDEDDLTRDLRILQRRRLEQSGETRKDR